jgi:hypothetical protein
MVGQDDNALGEPAGKHVRRTTRRSSFRPEEGHRMPRQYVRVWACALLVSSGGVNAQEARSPLGVLADSRMQHGAASLVPTLRGRWLYADHKLVVGRVQDVRVSADGNTLIAVVARRRWLGGGEIGIPVPHLRQADNDLTVSGTRETIRQIPLLSP